MESAAPQVSTTARMRAAMTCGRAAGVAVHDAISGQPMAHDAPAAPPHELTTLHRLCAAGQRGQTSRSACRRWCCMATQTQRWARSCGRASTASSQAPRCA